MYSAARIMNKFTDSYNFFVGAIVKSFIIQVSLTPKGFSEQDNRGFDLPSPAPSYLGIKATEDPVFSIKDVSKLYNLEELRFIVASHSSVTAIYLEGDKFIASFAKKSTNNDSFSEIVRSEIDGLIAKKIIALWADWLSKSAYKNREEEIVELVYAASKGLNNKLYEGNFGYSFENPLFSQRMINLVRDFNNYVAHLNFLENPEIIIPVKRKDLSEVVTRIRDELLKSTLELRMELDENIE